MASKQAKAGKKAGKAAKQAKAAGASDSKTASADKKTAQFNGQVVLAPWHKNPTVCELTFAERAIQHGALRHISFYREDAKAKGVKMDCSEFGKLEKLREYSGHNFSRADLQEFLKTCGATACTCSALATTLLKHLKEQAQYCYFISHVQADACTADHEGYHAVYSLSAEYAAFCLKLWNKLDAEFREFVEKKLNEDGYHESIWIDEFSAFTASDVNSWGNRWTKEARAAAASLKEAATQAMAAANKATTNASAGKSKSAGKHK